MRWMSRSVEDRQPVTIRDLQLSISEAVKKFDPTCETFIGVIIEFAEPKSRLDTNWTIKGVKYGSCDREKAAQAMAAITSRMQSEFKLSATSTRKAGWGYASSVSALLNLF
jgi:hypothetical protein